MNNIRPIGDPSLAAAMLSTFRSIDDARSAPMQISTDQVDAILAAIGAVASNDLPLTPAPTIVSFDFSAEPNFVAAELAAFGSDGKIEPLDPADVPACMRPDCTAPAVVVENDKQTAETNKHGRGSAAVARPHQGAEHCDRLVATDRISDVSQVRILPPANPSSNWIAERFQRIAGAIAFLKSRGILVTVVDRDAPIREYYVSGKRYRQLAEEVVEIAIAKGWVE